MRKLRRYLPIRIHSVYYGAGWWWGNYFVFWTTFAVLPMCWHYKLCVFARTSRAIQEGGDSRSWKRYDEQERPVQQ